MKNINKLLLTELRVIEGSEKRKEITQPNFGRAFVDIQNLKALGYELKEEAIVKLAFDYSADENFTPLYKRVQEFEPGITVSPMYPNFPLQVLEMDETELLVNQYIHYLTTYGVEAIFGVEVQQGWLPETIELIDRVEDIQVADLKVLDYLTPLEVDELVINNLIGRKERLEAKELEIAQAITLRTPLGIYEVPFKENIGSIFGELMLNGDTTTIHQVLGALDDIVKHPGDVLDFIEQLVVLNKYKHFKTSAKRGLVELIEKFPAHAIEENLASDRWSDKFLGKKGKKRSLNKNVALIDYLSYNRFSKNESSKEIVGKLKDGKLLSWNQRLERAYSALDLDKVRELLLQRPGIYFRQVNRVIGLDFDEKTVSKDLVSVAGQLKTQSIVSALNNFKGDVVVDRVFFNVLLAKLQTVEVEELKGKKVFIDDHDVDFSLSKLEISDKFAEGGYISNGMAIRIPEKAEFIRFFTYWNDERRIDIDLHGVSVDKRGNISHVGWNSRAKDGTLVHSGDITHSNATEYIDIDLKRAVEDNINTVQLNLNSFTNIPFSNIDTVFTGIQVLSRMREVVNLHDSKNVVFRHDLDFKAISVDYGMIDIDNRVMYVGGETSDERNDKNRFVKPQHKLTIRTYLDLLLATQGAEVVQNKEEADVILGLAKSDEDKYVSLIDKNFFM